MGLIVRIKRRRNGVENKLGDVGGRFVLRCGIGELKKGCGKRGRRKNVFEDRT